jgi:hypothetical protein
LHELQGISGIFRKFSSENELSKNFRSKNGISGAKPEFQEFLEISISF